MEKEMEEVFDRKVREKEKKLNETEVELRQKLKEAQEKLDEQREDLEEKMAAYDKVCTYSHKFFTTVFPHIISSLEYFPQQKFSLVGKKIKFAATN